MSKSLLQTKASLCFALPFRAELIPSRAAGNHRIGEDEKDVKHPRRLGVKSWALRLAKWKSWLTAVGDAPQVYRSMFIPGFSSLIMVGMSGDTSSAMNMPIVSYVVPSLLFEDVTLKKAAGPFPNAPVSNPPALSANSIKHER